MTRSVHSPVVPIVYVAELVAMIGEEENVPPREVLLGSGITEAQLQEPETLISYTQQLRVYKNALELSSKPGLGIRLGDRYQPMHHGVFWHAILCAESGRDSLRIAAQYAKIRGHMFDLVIREDENYVALKVPESVPLGAELHRVAVEEFLSMLSPHGSCQLFAMRPQEVYIDYPAPSYRAEYEKLFDCPIVFGAGTLELRLPLSFLEAQTSMSNAEMAQICEERCQSILTRLGSGGSTVELVRSHLIKAGRDLGIESIAERMCMAPRTLRRKLQDDGTTFRDVVADFRKSLALDYLESTDFTIDEIAYLLGYGDTANFSRAFRSWTGDSPAHYRRQKRYAES